MVFSSDDFEDGSRSFLPGQRVLTLAGVFTANRWKWVRIIFNM